MSTRAQRRIIKKLVTIAGSQRAAAEMVGTSQPCICLILQEKRDPSDRVMKKAAAIVAKHKG